MPKKRLGEQGQIINPTKYVLIQCTNSKRDSPARAKNLYDESDYFCKMKAYAEATGLKYRILSAKHGLLHPEDKIEPYNEFGLSESQAESIALELSAQRVNVVEVIAGKKYTNPLTPALERQGIDVVELCRGEGIGQRKATLTEKTAALENSSLGSFK
jgi:hypothetical protein